MQHFRIATVCTLLCLLFVSAYGPAGDTGAASSDEPNCGGEPLDVGPGDEPDLPVDILPETFAKPLGPWKGDLDGMVDRGVIRVSAAYGSYQYFYVRGRPRGAIVELMQHFERFLNKNLGRATYASMSSYYR